MQFSIEEAMQKNHKDLEGDLNELIDGKSPSKEGLYKNFDEYLKKMRNHFITEEQAIFSFYHIEDKENSDVVFKLMDQHVEILLMLEKIEKRIDEWSDIDFSELKRLLTEHVAIENNILYKNLDKDLNESERQFVLKKIEEM